MTNNPGYPFIETDDLRTGPDLHPTLLGLLPLVGQWRGTGKGGYPNSDDFEFAQEIRFSHDGRPFLAYESRMWLIDDEGRPIRPYARETGWWRPALASLQDGTVQEERDTNELDVLVTDASGVIELYAGQIDGTKFELSSDFVARTARASEVSAFHRLYGIVEGDLLYAVDKAADGHPLTPHLSARLTRVAG